MNRIGCKRTILAALLLFLAIGSPSHAQRAEPLPEELEGVGIEEHRNAEIPLDLAFTDETGREVTLARYFEPGKPVLLTLVYYRCPMLCTLVLNGMVEALRETGLTPGEDLELVTVSFDPVETPTLAKLKKQNYVKEYGDPSVAPAWHFLVGGEESVRRLTETIGFGYRWSDESKQFVHQAALFVLTPDGRLSRYLYGVMFEPRTLRLSLLEASEGEIGSPLDKIVLYCFHYDSDQGKYSIAATNVMRVGGVVTVLILASALIPIWIRSAKNKQPQPPGRES
ncbi:MAG: SCO family protein [Candidatus Eisenbacteria bacterium]|nr:SCO family protein [Candidatus Latescibacterota bacterium]MBD3302245.1 SCO family protein [Candidatus Eisenbacteria bacterium]